MHWRHARPSDAAGVRALMLMPNVTKLTTIAGTTDREASALALRAVTLDVALVLDDDGVRGWLGAVPDGEFQEVSGLMDVARYGPLRAVTIGRDGLRTLNPLLSAIPIASIDPANSFALRCLSGMGILIAHADTSSAKELARKGLPHGP